MSVSEEFIVFLKENLAQLGFVQARRMFGGVGLFCDGIMFALIKDDEVYFKTDAQTSLSYQAEGLKPFSYEVKKKMIALSYWRVPNRLFDDPDEFVNWARVGLHVAKVSQR